MTCGMHEYYLVPHVHIHITSKIGDVCKLCATERIFRLTWPQLWRHRSNVRGSGSWNFQRGRKKDGRKAIKNGDNRTVNPCPVGLWRPTRPVGGGPFWPPQISREPRNVTTSGKRRWIALVVNSPKRINFSKIEVTGQVKLRSNAKSYCFWLWRRLRPNKAL